MITSGTAAAPPPPQPVSEAEAEAEAGSGPPAAGCRTLPSGESQQT
jgi:hypothetical protein